MAQTKRIVPEAPAPETLPDDFDFGEMEEAGSSAVATPPAPPAKDRAQTPVKVMPTQRSVESPKEAPSRAAEESDPEFDAFLKRLNEVNVEPAPARRQEPAEAPKYKQATPPKAASPSVSAPNRGAAPARPEPPKAPVPPPSVEQELIDVFRSGYKEAGKQHSEDEPKKKKGLVVGIVAGVVVLGLAASIPFVLRGRNTNTATTIHPTETPVTSSTVDQSATAQKPSPATPAGALTSTKPNQQQPNAVQQQAQQTTAAPTQASVSAESMNQQLSANSQLPQGARNKSAAEPAPSGFGVPGMETASDNGAIGGLFKSQNKTVIGPSSVKVSAGVAGGMLIRKTPPEYPSIAKTARVSGTVVMAATITKTGRVSNLQVISGPAMLRQAAMDAVRNWVYKPYLLNNQPTEVQTTINVDFNL